MKFAQWGASFTKRTQQRVPVGTELRGAVLHDALRPHVSWSIITSFAPSPRREYGSMKQVKPGNTVLEGTHPAHQGRALLRTREAAEGLRATGRKVPEASVHALVSQRKAAKSKSGGVTKADRRKPKRRTDPNTETKRSKPVAIQRT